MPSEISQVRDLDVLLGTPIDVKLGNQEYKLPADCPVELYLRTMQIMQDDREISPAEEMEITAFFRDEVLKLFQVHQPDMTALPGAVGITMLGQFVFAVYGAQPDEDPPTLPPAPEPGPTSTQKPSKTQARPRKRASRSSSSSAS